MKKLLSIALCLGLLAGLFALPAGAEEAALATPPTPGAGADVWDGATMQPTTLVKRDGISYFEISTAEELAYIAQAGGDWLSYNYILTNDIILNDVTFTWDSDWTLMGSGSLHTWTPIGEFSGIFDGGDHVISGLYTSGGLFDDVGYTKGTIKNLHVVNSDSQIGGIAAEACGLISHCSFSGVVHQPVDGGNTGGIVGFSHDGSIQDCINYATVVGRSIYANTVGGITGENRWGGRLTGCINYGTIIAQGTYVGGIVGYGRVSYCVNYGNVVGKTQVGGIAGFADTTTSHCANYGSVQGDSRVGGIAGYAAYNYGGVPISYCANFAHITGGSTVGGILGRSENDTLVHCYNIGPVAADDGLAGAIVGYSDHFWGERSVYENCYYEIGSSGTTAFGNHDEAEDAEGVAEGKTATQLKTKSTFVGWHFEPYKEYEWSSTLIPADWTIDPNVNGGYPLPNGLPGAVGASVPVTGISLKETELSLGVGDGAYLTPRLSPANATVTACAWATSDESVVAVDGYGRIEARRPGRATVQVITIDGNLSAGCTVTVSGRTNNDYQLGALDLRSTAGGFQANVPVTKNAGNGGAKILLAAYDDQGRFLRLYSTEISGLSQGQTIPLSFFVNAPNVARVKAFVISSLWDLTPLGAAAEFPAAE